MSAKACPHPFPFRFHRTMAETELGSIKAKDRAEEIRAARSMAAACARLRDAILASLSAPVASQGPGEATTASPARIVAESGA